jgi:hypothetical protein
LNFYKTKHSRMRRLWHILLSAALFTLAAVAAFCVAWHFWFRGA